MSLINKIDHAKVLNLTEQIPLDDDQVNSRTLVQRDDLSMTLFSVATDQEIGGHSAQGDAMVNILSGEAEITIEGTIYHLTAGQSIVILRMPGTRYMPFKDFRCYWWSLNPTNARGYR